MKPARNHPWNYPAVPYRLSQVAQPEPAPTIKCNHPGCRVRLRSDNRSGYCKPHYSTHVKYGR